MTTFATTFKQEITRLARREIKQAATSLKASVARNRSALAALKAQLSSLKQQTNPPTPASIPSVSDKELAKARFSGGLIRKLRGRLGLSQVVFGKLVGVGVLTVLAWESGRRIKPKYHKAIVALRKMGKREVRAMVEAGKTVVG